MVLMNEFLHAMIILLIKSKIKDSKLIIYAGNIGEGQGLHKIVPQSAKFLGKNLPF